MPDRDRLYKAMVRGLQDVGDKMFAEAVRIVNVDKGTLKKSGFIRYLPDGVEWGFRAPYAARVNYGVPPGHTERVKRHYVRQHRRRYRFRTYVRVRAHYRGPFTRVYRRGVQGSHFIERSVDRYMPELGKIMVQRMRRELAA